MGSRESWSIKRAWYKQKLQALIGALGLSSAEATETQKYTEKYAEFDSAFGGREALQTSDPDYPEVKAKLESLSAELLEMMKADLANEA